MQLLGEQDIQARIIAGKYVFSAGCTDVIGGTITAGTADAASALLTWSPAFISAPIIQVSVMSGIGAVLTASNYLVQLTGVGVSNAYISQPSGSGCVIAITMVGQARL